MRANPTVPSREHLTPLYYFCALYAHRHQTYEEGLNCIQLQFIILAFIGAQHGTSYTGYHYNNTKMAYFNNINSNKILQSHTTTNNRKGTAKVLDELSQGRHNKRTR